MGTKEKNPQARLTLGEVQELSIGALRGSKTSATNAASVAKSIVAAEADGLSANTWAMRCFEKCLSGGGKS